MGARNSRRCCERRRYQRTNRALVALLAAYLVIALARKATHSDEWFPISSWALFSMVPNQQHDYAIELTEVDGKRIDPPLYFEDAGDLFWSAKYGVGRSMIQRIGAAAERDDAAAVELLRKDFEPLHLRGHQRVTYTLVARQYDPLQRWRNGGFDRIRTLATYRLGESGGIR